MEKSKSFPQYSSFFSGEFGFEDQSNSYNFNGPSQKGNGFATSSDPELKRKKRIASYNVFTVEGKLKSSARNSFKWIKSKFSDARYGMWISITWKYIGFNFNSFMGGSIFFFVLFSFCPPLKITTSVMKSGCSGSSLHGTYMHAMHHLLGSIIWGVLCVYWWKRVEVFIFSLLRIPSDFITNIYLLCN